MWANKGNFVNEVLPLYSGATFILGMGDDRTDEYLFSRLPEGAWSIHVGSGPSQARFSIADTVQVGILLHLLSMSKESRS
jgi:trehalose 6-phosphate synthase/phosphatase